MVLYRGIALSLALLFAAVGAVFLLAPDGAVTFLDRTAVFLGQPRVAPVEMGSGLFRALAVGYMYGVTLLAWMMFRRPHEPHWPALLGHAKLASSGAALTLWFVDAPYLLYLANAVVDGVIGCGALLLRRHAIAENRAHQNNERSHFSS